MFTSQEVIGDLGSELTNQISVLPISQEKAHPLDVFNIFAVTSYKKVFIYSKMSKVTKLSELEFQSEDPKPVVAWRRSFLPNGSYPKDQKYRNLPDPKLAVAWCNNIDIYKVFKSSELGMNVEVVHERCIVLSNDIKISKIQWISENSLICVDKTNKVLILDENSVDRPFEVVEKFPEGKQVLLGLDVVQDDGFSSTQKLVTINHESGISYFLTHGKSDEDKNYVIHSIKLNNWEQRISSLESIGDLPQAIEFAINCYHNRGLGVIGLPSEKTDRENVTAKVIERLIYSLFAEGPGKAFLIGNVSADVERNFREQTTNLINYCLEIQKSHPQVFLGLYTKYKLKSEETRFLEYLVKPILERRIETLYTSEMFEGFLNTLLMSKNPKLDVLEQCLLNLDLKRICVLDENRKEAEKEINEKLLSTLKAYTERPKDKKLLQAYIYYYNSIQKEFIEPLNILLGNPTEQNNFIIEKEVGEVIISFCHRFIKEGKGFSDLLNQQIQKETQTIEDVKKKIITFIFKSSPNENHIKNGVLRALLKFPKPFFKFLSSAFFSHRSPFLDNKFYPSKNAVQDIFSTLISKNDPTIISPDGMVWFYEFRAQCIAEKEVKFGRVDQNGNEIIGKEELLLFSKIFDSFCHDSSISLSPLEAAQTKQSRQQYLILMYESLEAANLKDLQIHEENLRKECFKYHFYKFAAKLWRKFDDENKIKEKHNKVLECLLKDDSTLETKRSQVFSYINEVRQEDKLPKMREAIRDHFLALFKVDNLQATNIILTIEGYDSLHSEIKEQFQTLPDNEKTDLMLKYLDIIINSEGIDSKQGIISDKRLYIDYIQLLCKDRKQEIVGFLTKHPEISDVDQILETIKDNNIAEANSYLLERKDEVGKAIETILQGITDSLQSFVQKLDEEAIKRDPENQEYKKYPKLKKDDSYPSIEATEEAEEAESFDNERKKKLFLKDYEYNLPEFEGVEVEEHRDIKESVKEQLDIAIRMCERNTIRKTMDESKMNDLWFQLMKTFYEPYQKLKIEFQGKNLVKKKVVEELVDDDDEVRESFRDDINGLLEKIESEKKKKDAASDPERKKEIDKVIERHENNLKKKRDLLNKLLEEARIKEEERKKKEEEEEKKSLKQLHKIANLWAQRVYYHHVMIVLRKMVTILPIPTILQKFIEELKDDEFSNIKRLALRLHSRYKHDKGLEETANNILKGDNFDLGKLFKKKKSTALSNNEENCRQCKTKFFDEKSNEKSGVRMFICGHGYHLSCIGDDINECPECSGKTIKTITAQKSKEITRKQDVANFMNIKSELYKMNERLDKKSNTKMDLYQHLVIDSKHSVLRFSDGLLLHPPKDPQKKNKSQDVLGFYSVSRMVDPKKVKGGEQRDNSLLDGLSN